jgi:hypothetical protein
MLEMCCSVLILVDLKHWKRIMSDAIQYAENLEIINYLAEREVKLIQALKKKKQGRQYLLQVVSEHWIKLPYAKRSLLVEES